MARTPKTIQAQLSKPTAENTGGLLTLMLPIVNTGTERFESVWCTRLQLGNTDRVSPPGFPLYLDSIGPGGTASFMAKYAASQLVVGRRESITMDIEFKVDAQTYTLTLKRYVVVPPVGPAILSKLSASAVTSVAGGFWNYTITNLEPATSPQHVAIFSLSVAAPVTVTGIPLGWKVETDNFSYVIWSSDVYVPPYASQIAPGSSLQGFQLMAPRTTSEANKFSLSGWNHSVDDAGLVFADYALVPHRAV